MRYTVLIPARLASTRLPNKPLEKLGGVPMVVRVAQRVRAGVSSSTRIVVAGDNISIIDACKKYGVEAVLTRENHASGSDRLAEASHLLGLEDSEIVVNVQGDEPLIDPNLVEAVATTLLQTPAASMGTAVHAISNVEDFLNPNIVKVVLDCNDMALYFSRAPISWWRDGFADGAYKLPEPPPLRHIGLYAYRVSFLRAFPHLHPAPMEQLESLEQLRALWHGHRIVAHITDLAPGQGVDTPEDLEKVRKLFNEA